jgi:hypothetical protein
MNTLETVYYRCNKSFAEKFSYEQLADMLNIVAKCSDRFEKPLPKELSRKALLLYEHLTSNGYYNQNLEESLTVVQAKSLLDQVRFHLQN